MTYDAIVVGAGHNGLVCAAYLARAGLRVVVMERRDHVGGMADTTELLPGVRVPALAHTVGRLRPQIARELGLRGHGLALVQPDVRLFAPQPDGRALTFWNDVPRTAAQLAASGLVSDGDAARFADVDAEARELGKCLADVMGRTPADLGAPSIGDALMGVRGLAVFARARSEYARLLRTMPMAVRDLVGEWFESDALQAAIAARGMLLTALGPRMPGTAGVLLTDLAGNDGGLAGQAVYARGGPGALADALAAAAKASGVEIRTKTGVAHVRRENDRVAGVVLDGGKKVDAPIVVSNLDPRTTLLDLLEPEVLGPRLSWRASNVRQTGVTAKVNFALSDLPAFKAAAGDARRLRGRILIAPSMRYLDLAARPARYGESAKEPLIEATIPSLIDPDLVKPRRGRKVKHVMSAILQAVSGDARDAGEIAARTLERYAPGFTDLIQERQVLAPADIEREYGNAGGHPMHAEVALDQWFEWRPLHGLGRHRMPLHGMYLCGSGAHPGGGVTGGPGRNAAQAILEDSSKRSRR